MSLRNRFMNRLRARAGKAIPFLAVALVSLLLAGCATRYRETNRTFTTVVIDAGHGGRDPGAVRNGVLEKTVALDVSRKLETRLQNAGFRTVLTRDRDVFVPLNRRAQISNAQSNAVFVSVHFNYARRRSHRGAETYFHSNHSRDLAAAIQREIARVSPPDRGIKRARFRVLRLNHFPAALVECGFVTNGSEAKRIASERHRDRIALAIANGIIRHRYPNGRLPSPAGPGASPSPPAVLRPVLE